MQKEHVFNVGGMQERGKAVKAILQAASVRLDREAKPQEISVEQSTIGINSIKTVRLISPSFPFETVIIAEAALDDGGTEVAIYNKILIPSIQKEITTYHLVLDKNLLEQPDNTAGLIQPDNLILQNNLDQQLTKTITTWEARE